MHGINQTALKVSADALAIDEQLRMASTEAVEEYKHLIKNAEKRAKLPPKKTSGSSNWTEKIAKMRETHPNAYKPWAAADDATLKTGFMNGASVGDLSKQLGRHEGSISMRLQKHFPEDVSL